MTTNTLQRVQATLEQRGVKDVKFLFAPGAHGKYPSDVKEDATEVLAKYLAGEFTDLKIFSEESLPQAFV